MEELMEVKQPKLDYLEWVISWLIFPLAVSQLWIQARQERDRLD
jgi:hypothetical protein